jgi:WD40 repeat protein
MDNHGDELATLRKRVADLESELADAATTEAALRATTLADAALFELDRAAHNQALLLALAAVRAAAPLDPLLSVTRALRRVLEQALPMRRQSSSTDNGVFAAWSPDGRTLAIAENTRFQGPSELIRLWDVAAGHITHTIPIDYDHDALWPDSSSIPGDQEPPLYHGGFTLHPLHWSPDGSLLLSSHQDGTVRLWDATTGILRHVFRGRTASELQASSWDRPLAPPIVTSVGWSPDGTRLLAAYEDGTARLWDIASGTLIYAIVDADAHVRSAMSSPDARFLAIGTYDQEIYIWDVATGALLCLFDSLDGPVVRLAWSPDSTQLLSYSRPDDADPIGQAALDHTRLWDAMTGELLHTFDGALERVWAAPWSPRGSQVLTIDDEALIRVWNAKTGTLICTIPVGDPLSFTDHVVWSPDERALLVQNRDGLGLWDVASGRKHLNFPLDHAFTIAWSPDQRWIGVAGYEDGFVAWDVATRQPTWLLASGMGWPWAVAWAADGVRIIHGPDGSRFYRLQVYDPVHAVAGPQVDVPDRQSPQSVYWYPDGRRVLIATVAQVAKDDGSADEAMPAMSMSSRMLVWDTVTSTIQELDDPLSSHFNAVWSPDGARYALVGYDTIQIRDTATDAVLHRLVTPEGARSVCWIAWSPDSALLLLVAQIWDAARGADTLRALVWDVARDALLHAVSLVNTHSMFCLGVGWGPSGPQMLTTVWGAARVEVQAVAQEDTPPTVGSTDGWESSDRQLNVQIAGSALVLWDLARGEPLRELAGSTYWGERAIWSPNGQHILVRDKPVAWILDAASGDVAQVLEGYDGHIALERWSADGQQVLTYDYHPLKGRLRLWTVAPRLLKAELTRRVIERYIDHPGSFYRGETGSDEGIRQHIPDWRGSSEELEAVADDLAAYDALTSPMRRPESGEAPASG